MSVRISPSVFGLFLLAFGLWALVKNVLLLDWGFTVATLLILAGVAWVAALRRRDFLGYGTAGWLLVAWAVYATIDGMLGGRLPGSLWLAFIGAGFVPVYLFHTRPAIWPLVPAGILAAIGIGFFVLGMALHLTFKFAYIILPLLLVYWGVKAMIKRRPHKDTGGWE